MTSIARLPKSVVEPFYVEVELGRDAVRVVPIGELDLATVPELASQIKELRDVGYERLVLDLRRLKFIDSTGLHLILKLDGQARREGREFLVIPGPPAIQRVFEVAGIDGYLNFQHRSAATEQDHRPRTRIGARVASARDAMQLQRFIAELRRRPRRADNARHALSPAAAHAGPSSSSHSLSVANLGRAEDAPVTDDKASPPV